MPKKKVVEAAACIARMETVMEAVAWMDRPHGPMQAWEVGGSRATSIAEGGRKMRRCRRCGATQLELSGVDKRRTWR